MNRYALILAVGLALLAPAGAEGATGTLESALSTLEEQLDSQPRNPALWTDYANLLVVADRFDQARSAYETALDLSPDSILAHYNLGVLKLEKGKPRNAASHFRKVLAQDSSHARAEYALGAALAARNRHRRAVEHYSRAFSLDQSLIEPDHNPEILFNELATWASMHSYLGDTTGRATRLYHDPRPILGLLIPGLDEIEDAVQSDPATDSEEAEGVPEEEEAETAVENDGG